MKNIKSTLAIFFLIVGFIACDSVEPLRDDRYPPSAPRNVEVFAIDDVVEIYWSHNSESDLSHYNIYVNNTYQGDYLLIGSTTNNYFVDDEVNNGETYYYAITAVDQSHNESELSFDVAFGIPRPDDFNEVIYDYRTFPSISGFSFDLESVVPYNDNYTDFFFENYDGTFYLNVWADSDIQDVGITNDIYDVTLAPSTGWVPVVGNDNVKYVEAQINHTYVIWTLTNNYAKIRISNITNERIVFDWAYQLVPGERQLKKNVQPISKEQLILNRK